MTDGATTTGRPRRLVLLILGALLAVSLAGCLGEEAADPESRGQSLRQDPGPRDGAAQGVPPSPSPSDQATGDLPGETGPRPDLPPNATLLADVHEGLAPLDVTFFITAEDPEGGPVDWELILPGDRIVEGNKSALPTNVSHQFGSGDHLVTLAVHDVNHTVEHQVWVNATDPPPYRAPDPVRFNGTITGVWTDAFGYLPGSALHEFDLAVPVQNITIRLQAGEGSIDLDYEVYDPTGTRIARAANPNEPTDAAPVGFAGAQEPATVIEGASAKRTGTWTVRVMPALAIEGDYTVDVIFH